MHSQFTVGTDTEFFLQDENGYVSAIRYIAAGKHNPLTLPSGGNITHDNVALEFATPVANSEDGLISAVESSLKESLSCLPDGITLDLAPSTDFPESELQDEEARMFGCDPDYDAWDLCMNEAPDDAAEKPFRTVGGHLHLGYVEKSGNDFLLEPMGKVFTVKTLDAIVGVTMTIFDYTEATVNRRKLYGKAGCHRPTEYGVEYRALSNFWLFSPSLVRLVYNLASESLRLVREGKIDSILDSIGEKEIRRIIDTGDNVAAMGVWNTVITPNMSERTIKLFEECISKQEINLYNEWGL